MNDGSSEWPSSGQTPIPDERHDPDGDIGHARRPGGPFQQGRVMALQPDDDRRFTPFESRVAQQDQAERRRHRHRHDERGRNREHIGCNQRLEEGSGQALHEQDGHDRGDHDEGRVDDRRPHLERSVQNDARRASRIARAPRKTQSPHDVLDVEDRIVDDNPQRDDEARQDHGVDRGAGL